MDISRGEIVETLVAAMMVVVIDESLNLSIKIAKHEVVFQQDTVLWGLVPAFCEQIILEISIRTILSEEKLLRAVQEIRARQSERYDLAFTLRAKSDPSIRKLVNRIRDIRTASIEGILADTGCTGKELEARARLFVESFSWSEVMCQQTATGLESEPLDKILEIICGSGSGES
jgi:hypothetical protein